MENKKKKRKKEKMATTKFLRSLKTLEEMFFYRIQFDESFYRKAHDDIVVYLKNEEYENEMNKEDKIIDVGSIRIIYNLNEKWDASQLSQRKKMEIQKNDDKIKHYIFVLTKPNTFYHISKDSTLLRFIIKDLGKTGEIFYLSELQYNVTQHSLVPKHEIIKDDKIKEQLKKDYHIETFTQFPLILNTDPVVRFIGGKEGDIIKITRRKGLPKSGQAGEHILYRYCVEGKIYNRNKE